ncbi:autotransporter domain-containing protein [Bosea sp. NPDC055332]
MLAGPALANGGSGGGAGGGSVGGLDNPDSAGNVGGNGDFVTGGAGGGAGLSGGVGGSSPGAAGGQGGLNPGDLGGFGNDGPAGAGGGGGAHGSVSATAPSGFKQGGAGGSGGQGQGLGGGGGGGAGGWGAVITGTGALGSVTGSGGNVATGGAGGAGGGSTGGVSAGGGGGSGGHGLAVTGGAGTSLTLSGVAQGGVGGAGGFGLGGLPGGSGGAGGAGLLLSGASTVTIDANVRGGNGGAGGSASGGTGGAGGAGGHGVFVANGGTVNVNASVVGGFGGAGGTGATSGAAGENGAGIAGNNLTVVLGAGGLISDADGAGGILGDALQVSGSSKLTVAVAGTANIIGNINIASGTLTLDQGAGVGVTIANTITGAGALAKDGAGTVTLTGTNTYAGGTTFNGGTLSVSQDANLGNASGGLTFNGGSLQVTASFTTARTTTLNAHGTVEVTAGQNFTMGGAIFGTGGIVKTGSGTLTLTGTNFFTGGTQISQGTVSVSSDANLGAAGTTITLNNTTIVGGAGTGADAVLRTTASFSSNRNIAFANGGGRIETDTGTTLTLTGSITTGGSASFIKQGAGTLVLTGDSSAGYNGRTWVNEGTLRIEGGGKLGSNSAGGQAYISNGATAIVTGAGSSWETFGQMRVGEHGSGTLRIENGGSVTTGGGGGTVGIVGAGGDSSVTITGSGSQWVGNGTQLYVGHSNAGSLTLSDGGKFELTGASSVLQAGLVGGSAGGTINIGAAEGSAAATAGTLVVDTVSLNTSASKVVFNHTDVGYGFSATITGTGSVRQLAGITVLTGNNNDYSGQTQVLGGRLIAGSSGGFSANSDYTVASGAVLEVAGGFGTVATIGSLSGAGFVRIGTDETLITGTTNQTATFSGTFLGDGSLGFDGSGTQIVTGTGTLGGDLSICSCSTGSFIIRGGSLSFGGGVQVDAGTLVLDQGASLTAASNIEVVGGTLVVSEGSRLDNGPATFFVVSTVRIDGAGTLVTTGNLLVMGVFAPASVTVSAGATLDGGAGAAVGGFGATASVLVTGTGSQWKVGGGGLGIGGSGSTDAASVTVADGGALVITSGDLGIGSLGTLNIGSGGKAGSVTLAAGAILNDGAIIADFTDTATLAMPIDGTGTVTKRGSGTLTLTGTSTYTGATKVTAGKLVVNGSITSNVTLDGGTLGGSGTVGAVSVGSGATVAPGNSIGTLTVSGNVSFASGSTYQVEVNAAGQGDKIVASGSATITGGRVEVLAASGNYAAATNYTILTAAGGVTGRFSTVTSNLAFLTPSLGYDANNVTLTMTRNDTGFGPDGGGGGGGGGGTSGGGSTSSNYVAATRNQGFIANAAEALGVGNPVYDALISATAAEARAGFDLLSGEAHAQAVSVMIDESRLVRESILNRLRGPLLTQAPGQVAAGFTADLPGRKGAVVMPAPVPQPRYTLWGEAFGSAGNSDADGNAASLSRRSGGALLGADLMLYDAPGSSLKVGVAGGYSQSRFDLDARLSTGKLESGHAALYAGARFGQLRLDAGAAYSWSESDIRRQVAIRGFGDLLRLQRPGSVLQGFAELGYGFAFSGFALEPFAQLALLRVSTDAGTEQGGAAALRVLSSDQTLGFTTLGLRAEAQLGTMPLFARAMLGWRHGFGELTPQARTAFALGTNPAVVFAAPIDRNALTAEAGLDWRISQATALGLTYSAAIGERSRDHALKGRVEMRF